MKIRISLVVTALLFLGLPSLAFSQQRVADQTSDPTGPVKGAVNSASAPVIPADYRIGVSDVVDVSVWKVPDLSRSVPVRPDGKISLPLIGDVDAAGKTTGELHDLVVTRLKPYVPDPDVTVIVAQINSQKYFVLGQVTHPGSYPLSTPTTVVEALAAAGGFLDWAHTNKIMVVRHAPSNQTERIRFNYNDWLKKKGNDGSSVKLQSGDVIVVP